MMLFLAAYRRVLLMHKMTQEGRWGEGRPYHDDIPRLWGLAIGLISFGNVAKAVARRCHAFGLRVLAYDPFVNELGGPAGTCGHTRFRPMRDLPHEGPADTRDSVP